MGWFNKGSESHRTDEPTRDARPSLPEVPAHPSAASSDTSTARAEPPPAMPRQEVRPFEPPRPEPTPRGSLASLFTARGTGADALATDSLPDLGADGEPASVFSESVDIEGSLEGNGDVVLKGKVRGSINVTGSLIVSQTGSVQADVSAREVINAGTIEGNIRAVEKVRVQATGVVHGDIDSPSIVIDDGGGVEGFVQMEPPGGVDVDEDEAGPQHSRPAATPPAPGVATSAPASRSREPVAVRPPAPPDPLAVFFDEGQGGAEASPTGADDPLLSDEGMPLGETSGSEAPGDLPPGYTPEEQAFLRSLSAGSTGTAPAQPWRPVPTPPAQP
jgi:cytoskeletal protein CcmA (bactofilin family)